VELSGVTVDEVELVGDIARGGLDAALDGAGVGSESDALLDGNDVPARDGLPSGGDGDELGFGRHQGRAVGWWGRTRRVDRFYSGC